MNSANFTMATNKFTALNVTDNDVITGTAVGTEFDSKTRMWANAQRDGRPSECRWRPLFNAANFG